MYDVLRALGQHRRRAAAPSPITWAGWPHGLNTVLPASQITAKELASALNWRYGQNGQVITRPPVYRYTAAATIDAAPVVAAETVVVGGNTYTLEVDDQGRIYYLDVDREPVQITGTLENPPQIVAFGGFAVICDGGYLKYLDGTSAVKIAYDEGAGASGYQWQNLTATPAGSLPLGNGTTTRVAQKVTTQAWTAGYTIPTVRIEVSLSKTGAGYAGTDNLPVVAKLRKVSDDSVVATHNLTETAGELGAVAETIVAEFAAADLTAEMAPETAYYLSIEYGNGDASNYVNVHYSDAAAAAGKAYTYAGSWTADTAKDLIAGLAPGRPPKADHACVWDNRLWSRDPDALGLVRFCQVGFFDWCTEGVAGRIYVGDEDENNFPVGALADIYDVLWVFGTEAHPYLAKISGNTTDGYQCKPVYHRPWTTARALISAVNDLWFANAQGVDALGGIQEFGDVRSWSYADAVSNRISRYWTADAIAGYFPPHGQYWLCLPGYHRILVAHTKNPSVSYDQRVRYPWSEYEIAREALSDADAYQWTLSGSGTNEYYLEAAGGGDPGVAAPDYLLRHARVLTEGTPGSLGHHRWGYGDTDTLGFDTIYLRDDDAAPASAGEDLRTVMVPTCLSAAGSTMLIGGSDGHLYYVNQAGYREMGAHQIATDLRTSYVAIPGRHVEVAQYMLDIAATTGGRVVLEVYTDDRFLEPLTSITHTLSMDDSLTVADLTMQVQDALFSLEPAQNPIYGYRRWRCRSVQLRLASTLIAGTPIYVNSMTLLARALEV